MQPEEFLASKKFLGMGLVAKTLEGQDAGCWFKVLGVDDWTIGLVDEVVVDVVVVG